MVAPSKFLMARTPQQEAVFQRWKGEVKNFLIICKTGISVKRLESQLVEMVGVRIPYQSMGLSTWVEFIYECRDIFDVGIIPYDTSPFANRFLFIRSNAIDASTADLHELVSGQERGKAKKSNSGMPLDPSRRQVKIVDASYLLNSVGRSSSTAYGSSERGRSVGSWQRPAYQKPTTSAYGAPSARYSSGKSYTVKGPSNSSNPWKYPSNPATGSSGSQWNFPMRPAAQPASRPSPLMPLPSGLADDFDDDYVGEDDDFDYCGGSTTKAVTPGPVVREKVDTHDSRMDSRQIRFGPTSPVREKMDSRMDTKQVESRWVRIDPYGPAANPPPSSPVGGKMRLMNVRLGLDESSPRVQRLNLQTLPDKEVKSGYAAYSPLSEEEMKGWSYKPEIQTKVEDYDCVDSGERRPPKPVIKSNENRIPIPNYHSIRMASVTAAVAGTTIGQSGERPPIPTDHSLRPSRAVAVAEGFTIPIENGLPVRTETSNPNGISVPSEMGPRPQQIPRKGQLWQIVILEVDRTLRYDFIFRKKKDHDSLIVLEKGFTDFYESPSGKKMVVNKDLLSLGFYAGKCLNTKLWFRVELLTVPQNKNNLVTVYLYDYGRYAMVDMEKSGLCYLKEEFTTVPRTAYYGKVVNAGIPSTFEELKRKASEQVPVAITCEGFAKDENSSTPIVFVVV